MSRPHITLPENIWRVLEQSWAGYVLLAASVGCPLLVGFVSKWWLILPLIILTLVCVVLVAYRADTLKKRQASLLKTATDTAEEAVAELTLLLGDLIEPIAELLGRLVAASKATERTQLAVRLTEKIVQAASAICGPNDTTSTRAVFFQIEGDPADRLTFKTHHGRGAKPRQDMPPEALALALSRKGVLVPNIETDVPNPADFRDASYKTFISCSVYAGEHVFGLLTVDARQTGTLAKRDLRTTQVLAHLLGSGLAAAKRK